MSRLRLDGAVTCFVPKEEASSLNSRRESLCQPRFSRMQFAWNRPLHFKFNKHINNRKHIWRLGSLLSTPQTHMKIWPSVTYLIMNHCAKSWGLKIIDTAEIDHQRHCRRLTFGACCCMSYGYQQNYENNIEGKVIFKFGGKFPSNRPVTDFM